MSAAFRSASESMSEPLGLDAPGEAAAAGVADVTEMAQAEEVAEAAGFGADVAPGLGEFAEVDAPVVTLPLAPPPLVPTPLISTDLRDMPQWMTERMPALFAHPADVTAYGGPDPSVQRVERLPFTIRSIVEESDLSRAAQLRQSAYARHLPRFADRLGKPEAADSVGRTVVLLAESKMDGKPLATLRIHLNVDQRLPLESAVSVPDHMRGYVLSEAVRLAVVGGREGRLPRDAMFKAYYLACLALHVDWMVICARPPLQRRYLEMHFDDISVSEARVPMLHIGNIAHRVLKFNVNTAKKVWFARRQPMYSFVFRTYHPDIEDFRHTLSGLAEHVLKRKAEWAKLRARLIA